MVALIRTSLRASSGSLKRNIVNMSSVRAKHSLPDLPYGYDALEPSISKEIMTLHHTKHHQTYVNGLNAAEESLAKFQSSGDVKGQLGLQAALKFNGGGHINHSLFWKNLAPSSSSSAKPDAAPTFVKQVEKDFGSLEDLKTEMNTKTAAVQGSGWGWLGYDKGKKRLEVVTTANQDPLLTHVPIIGIDVWEHAFYLQYKNVKPDYLKAIWDVINFEEAEKRFTAVQ
ncbi:Manganese/iron superoxide dismutase [Dioszegia hungarica]|uniref:Superoxide dismutase n=1 Tax=Dioszegia hungarica TaxID=4972 RepID=A0AA38H4F8_9TREE|nr:Manganese/iron superoxide dismutase [Dioszegia hungarica]KAI9633742.1 Manganese/iron superoxide dismutase [Dioszegia hungarica]